jgi:PhzF family phenazine biosynthesis protein
MRIRIIDAFTDRPFAGNPAGVCLLDAGTWPGEAWMRGVAAGLSHETAFARPLPDGADSDWALRWFTPAAESNVCGHATLATAHALHTDRGTPLTVRFASHFGILTARTRRDGSITLDFPAAFPAEAPAPGGLGQALGAEPGATYSTGALGDLLTIASDEAAVRALQPDFTALERLTATTASAGSSSPPPQRTGTAAMTSSPGTSHQRAASPKTRSPAAPTPPWPPTGPAALAATASPACRPPPALA